MATGNNRDVRLGIEVATSGEGRVKALAGDLRQLAAEGGDAAPAFGRLADELDRSAAEAEQAQAATKHLRDARREAEAAERSAKRALAESNAELARLKVNTDAAARSDDAYRSRVRELGSAIVDQKLAVQAAVAARQAATGRANEAAQAEQRLAEQIKLQTAAVREVITRQAAAAQQAAGANTTLRDSLSRTGAELSAVARAAQLATAGVGAFAGGAAIASVARVADAYSNLAARIKLVTGEGAAFNEAFEGVQQIALRTNSTLEATGTLFTRIAQAGREIGLTQRDALALTETINQAVQVSGSSAEASSAAITQLIQGLQSGVLRGEEFNSVMEQAPRLAQALAAGLGVTTGELRKMAEAGSLTSATVINALQGQSAALQREFESLPPTIGRAIQNLSTAWSVYVGSADAGTGASAAAARAITALAGNLETLGNLLLGVGKGYAAFKALRLAEEFLGIGRAAKVAAAEVAAANTALAASGAAGTAAAAGAGRFAAILGSLKAFTLVGVLTNLESIGKFLGEGAAKLLGYGKAIDQLDAQMRAEAEAARASAAAKAELAQRMQQAADKALGLTDASRRLVGEFTNVTTKGGSAREAVEKLGKALDLGDLAGITDAGAALDALAVRGKLSAQGIGDAYALALKDVDLAQFETQARAAFDSSEQGARRLAAALDAIADESLRRAGTSADELRSGINRAAVSAINDVDALANTLRELKITGDESGRALAGSLDRALDAAKTERAVREVIARLEDLGKRGEIAGDQLAEGFEKARRKLDDLKPGVNSLNEALRNFGLKSREELQATADKLGASYKQIAGNVNVSLRDQIAALAQYRAAAEAAGDKAALAQIKVQEEILRTRAQVEGLGGEFERQFDRGGKSAEGFVESVLRAQRELERLNATAAASNLSSGLDERNRSVRSTLGDNLDAEGFVVDRQGNRVGAPGTGEREGFRFDAQRFQRDFNAYQRMVGTGAGAHFAAPDPERYYVPVAQPGNTSTPDATTSARAPAPSTTQTIRIELGGRATTVNVASQQDANALTSLLQQLQTAASRTA